MSEHEGTSWKIAGEFMEACSCEFLCPCLPSNASAPASNDFCRFAMTYRIDEGRFGNVDLKGVVFTVVAESKEIMSAGGWKLGAIVDDRASEGQADAIGQIVGGGVGGPLGAFAPLISDFLGVERHPIRFEMAGNRREVVIPGVLEQTVEGVPSAVASGQCLAIDNVFHPANTRLNLATAVKNLISCFGISWNDATNRNGHFAPFSWQGSA
jgi:hypothetical protein